ncbi:MAG: DNA topoisomerase I [Parcubacteria group bacterium Athens1014_10]|nr:MAG: DNA topoisomerase I [Parcubacteria group bacterium Athens1014_10]TSD06127.1 MAG: DNA topoisomerase I [Parcubacteria group bacterium Athens0714_12]
MNLLIVESPTKAKTISKFLSKDYKIESSYGHIRDLPKSKLGIDVENNFQPSYIIPVKSKKIASNLKKIAQKAKIIFFATDEDREGEAISWHLAQILNQPEEKIKRIAFHEITKEAVEEALKNPREIDINLVNAQQARRILDRLVGYKLSPFLWRKIARGLSAGRVQSAALRLIVEREKEIKNFKPQEYWTVSALLSKLKDEQKTFASELIKIKGKAIPKLGIANEKQANQILEGLKNGSYKVSDIQKKEIKKYPPTPFTTSLLQQEANKKFGFTAKKTMFIAQQLYEGVELDKEGHIGLITYMRTDSFNLADKFLEQARKFIKEKIGAEYTPEKPNRFKTKAKLTQEAHEAIRPTSANKIPDEIKEFLTEEQYKLYKLIWQRSIASQMKEAIFDSTGVEIIAANDYLFKAHGSIIKFDGFLKIYPSKVEENILPNLEINEGLKLEKLDKKQHFTEGPARYSEASLIKALEENGIGRPSTYAPIINVIQNRNYVQKENNKFAPTEIGVSVNDLLVEHFPKIVDLEFTAKMEDDLDKIAQAEKEWVPVLKEFYEPFEKNLINKEKEVAKKKPIEEKTDEICEKCGKPMVVKMSRYGKFLGCSGFPECKNIKSLAHNLGIKCPKCEKGELVEKKTKKRRIFYACDNFPECKFALWQKPINKFCPKCGNILTEGKNKPLIFSEQVAHSITKRDSEKVGGKISCSNKECDYCYENTKNYETTK